MCAAELVFCNVTSWAGEHIMIVVHHKCATQNVEWVTDCVRVHDGSYGSSHGLTDPKPPLRVVEPWCVVEHGVFGFVFCVLRLGFEKKQMMMH